MSIQRAGAMRTGFSLLELMIVLVIMGVLASVVTFNMIGQARKAKKDATLATMKVVEQALTQYQVTYSIFPPSTGAGGTGLQALVDDGILTELPKDGWTKLIDYVSPLQDSPWILVSAGDDGVFNTPDDVIKRPPPQVQAQPGGMVP